MYSNTSFFCDKFASAERCHMKTLVYFAGSIRGGRTDAALYSRMIDFIKNYAVVLTEHIGNPHLMGWYTRMYHLHSQE